MLNDKPFICEDQKIQLLNGNDNQNLKIDQQQNSFFKSYLNDYELPLSDEWFDRKFGNYSSETDEFIATNL